MIITVTPPMTDRELLAELRALRDWLRDGQSGIAASNARRRIKQIEQELADRRIDPEVTEHQRARQPGRTRWYVVDVDENSSRDRMLHLDRDCLHLSASKVREATDLEVERLKPCSTCG